MNYKDYIVNCINKHSQKYKLIPSKYGHYFLDPIPTNKELNDFYQDNYFNDNDVTASRGMDIGSEDIKERYHYDRTYEELINNIQQHINKKNIYDSFVLDIGCGLGNCLKHLKNIGFKNLFGTEWDASLNISGVEIFNGDFLDFDSSLKFDVILVNNVLEHVINPEIFIAKVWSLLKNNGILRVQVPNDISFIQYKLLQINEKAFTFFCPPEHIQYFDFTSLHNFLEQNGFNVYKTTTTFPMEFFVLMGMDYTKDCFLGKQCHKKRISFEYNASEPLLSSLYDKLAEIDLGRCVIKYSMKVI